MNRNLFGLNRDQICRLIGIAAMMVWSFVLLWFYASGRIEAYIRPEYLRLACLAGGLGLGVLSVFNLIHLRDPGGCGGCGCAHQEAGTSHPGSGEGHHHAADDEHEDGCCHGQEDGCHRTGAPGSHHGHHECSDHDHPGCCHHVEEDCCHHGPGATPHGSGHPRAPAAQVSGDESEEWDTSYSGNVAMFVVMVLPLLAAASYSKDRYLSANTIRNKGFVEDTAAVARSVEKELARTRGESPDMAVAREAKEDSWEYTLADLEKVVDRSPDGNLMLTVDQLYYTSGDFELQRILDGQAVETVGQVIPYDPKRPHPSRLRVFTLMITCCAADAQPVSIPVEFTGSPPGFDEMSWVKVSGIMQYPKEDGRVVPLLRMKSMAPTEEPYSDTVY